MIKNPCNKCVVLACCTRPCEKLTKFLLFMNHLANFTLIIPLFVEVAIFGYIFKLFGLEAALLLYAVLFLITMAFTNILRINEDIYDHQAPKLLLFFLFLLIPLCLLGVIVKTLTMKLFGKFPAFLKTTGGEKTAFGLRNNFKRGNKSETTG